MTNEQIQKMIADVHAALDAAGRPMVAFAGDARIESGASLNRYFDHTLLKPEATADQYETLCDQARQYETRSVCVPPDRVPLCVSRLAGSTVEVCTVIGFPLGYHSTGAKVAEVRHTLGEGATEFDMVIPVGRLRDGDPGAVYDDVRAVVDAAEGRIVKVILEMVLLSEAERVAAAVAAVRAGAAILKTSTGFASGGATVEDLAILRLVAGADRGVKAAGGIRTLEFARACIDAGADRLGASATVSILGEAAGANAQSDSEGGGY
ncbi:MAG: deoxyribose-phosphate aldolase [Spirochaeta sp.]|nr:deoxyribose-phosphate aldolase [Spirochaeta sp.]